MVQRSHPAREWPEMDEWQLWESLQDPFYVRGYMFFEILNDGTQERVSSMDRPEGGIGGKPLNIPPEAIKKGRKRQKEGGTPD